MATVGLIRNASPNFIINGNFDFWQRNTSFTTPSSATYTSDRWRVDYNGTIGTFTVSRQAFTLGQTDVPNEPTYFLRWNQTVAGSGSTVRVLQQRIEGVRTLAGKTCTVSFWAKADASRTVALSLNQFFGTGGSPSADVTTAQQNANLTTSWQKFTYQFVVPSISGKTLGTNGNNTLDLIFFLPLNTVMTIDFAQVMVNEGPAPANFSLAGETLGGELLLCQRYFEKTYRIDTPVGTATILGAVLCTASSTTHREPIRYQVTKRSSNPTFTTYNYNSGASGSWRDNTAGADRTAATSNDHSESQAAVQIISSVTGNLTIGHWTADAEL